MADKSSVKEPRSAAVVTIAAKLDEARSELNILKSQANRLQGENVELASAAAAAKAALDASEKAAAGQVATLKALAGSESGRADSLAAELAATRAELADERSAASSALASKAQDGELIAGLRGEVKDLQEKLYRIRDAVKAV